MNSQLLNIIITILIAPSCLTATAAAQFGIRDTDDSGTEAETKQYWQLGMIITAAGGPCRGVVGSVPIPIDWPEQDVRPVEEDISTLVRRVTYRKLGGSVEQMVVEVPYIPAGEEVRAVVTLEVVRRAVEAPEETSSLVIPEKPDRLLRPLLGPSPYIESRHSKIRSLAKDILSDKSAVSDWEKVEALYDWVRNNVTYKNGPIEGALHALQTGEGDCEELTSLFIALCRASDVPARTVWLPGHCYPEFYLEDAQGAGDWFPCEAAGDRAFGRMNATKIILQKGDNFRDPDRPRQRLRYVSEHLTGKGGSPKVQFIRASVDAPE